MKHFLKLTTSKDLAVSSPREKPKVLLCIVQNKIRLQKCSVRFLFNIALYFMLCLGQRNLDLATIWAFSWELCQFHLFSSQKVYTLPPVTNWQQLS